MKKIMLNPDNSFKPMVNNPNPPYDKILVFLRNEAISMIELRNLIKRSKETNDFDRFKKLMITECNNIRSESLDILEANYNSIFHRKELKHLKRLRNILGR